jgi:hypothetical protein
MTKIKLYGIGNDGDFNFYIFDKKQEVAKIISNLFKEIFNITWSFTKEEEDEKGEWIAEKINIEQKKDVHQRLTRTSPREPPVRIDIFYGDKKMFVSVHCKEKERLTFNKALIKVAEMPKSIKIKEKKK